MTATDRIRQAVREAVARHGRLTVDVMTLADDAPLYDLGLSSQHCVSILMALEAALDVELPDELLTRQTFSSIGRLVDALSQAGAAD